MAFKMNYNRGNFPFKQNGGDPPKWWKKLIKKEKPHYTDEDVEFLEEQHEDIVRKKDKN